MVQRDRKENFSDDKFSKLFYYTQVPHGSSGCFVIYADKPAGFGGKVVSAPTPSPFYSSRFPSVSSDSRHLASARGRWFPPSYSETRQVPRGGCDPDTEFLGARQGRGLSGGPPRPARRTRFELPTLGGVPSLSSFQEDSSSFRVYCQAWLGKAGTQNLE